MFRGFSRKSFTFLVTATLAVFLSVYLHSCQLSGEPSATLSASPSVVSSQSSPVTSPSPGDCDESDESDCQEKRSNLDWLLGAYAALGNSYQGFIVDFRDNAPDVKNIGQVNGLQVSDVLPSEKTYLLQGGLEELNKLRDSGLAAYIRYIEPNYLYKQASSVAANDQYYREQWNLKAIHIEDAWKTTRGEGITVAILDTGIALVDDFNPGTFTRGYDYVSNPEKPIEVLSRNPDEASGGNPHGTNIAGIIAQATNNSLGFAGIAPASKLMPIRVLNDQGIGDAEDIAKGIKWAVDNGADVINCSLSIINETASNNLVREAIQYAKSKGVVVVAAAGNEGRQAISFPASDKNAIAVGAYTPKLSRASFSNYGSKISIFAPGGQGVPNPSRNKSSVANLEQAVCKAIGISANDPLMDVGIAQWWTKMTYRSGEEIFEPKGGVCSGTSQATAAVSGVVALIESKGVKDPELIKKILIDSADKDCYDLSESQRSNTQDSTEVSPSPNPVRSEMEILESKQQGKPVPEPSDAWDPGKIGRLDAGAAVKLASDLMNPAMRDNIALAKHLTTIGAKFYESCGCYENYPERAKEQFGPAAFSEIAFVPIRHSAGEYGWKIRGKFIDEIFQEKEIYYVDRIFPGLEALADASGYVNGRNFVVPDKYKQPDEEYKQQKAERARMRSQSTPN